jgi:DNA repair photolyase
MLGNISKCCIEEANMILSVSRRTDIPNYYSDWFLDKVSNGYLYVRNPMNNNQVSKITINPEVIDCMVFWTKNPKNMITRLDELKDYPSYFQFTLTPYGKDIEPGLPSKRDELIDTFITLSNKIGKERVIWRYDPILINNKYTLEYHIKTFSDIAKRLKGYTEKVIISFIDSYAKIKKNMKELKITNMSEEDMKTMAREFANIASDNNLIIETCAEMIDLKEYGISHGKCIDDNLISRISGAKLDIKKDRNQRKECGCMESIDVGAYNTCINGCKYCYANFNEATVMNKNALYNIESPLLCGVIREEDNITERKVKSMIQS